MNHQAEIDGINSLQERSESAIMACDSVAVLPGMRQDSARLNQSSNTQ